MFLSQFISEQFDIYNMQNCNEVILKMGGSKVFDMYGKFSITKVVQRIDVLRSGNVKQHTITYILMTVSSMLAHCLICRKALEIICSLFQLWVYDQYREN
uniref:Uncharacterized protein n=1 Tax=Arion vulgaris TaxID=1028688 RepID=A0A0B7B0R4_9EUPU